MNNRLRNTLWVAIGFVLLNGGFIYLSVNFVEFAEYFNYLYLASVLGYVSVVGSVFATDERVSKLFEDVANDAKQVILEDGKVTRDDLKRVIQMLKNEGYLGELIVIITDELNNEEEADS